MTYTVDVEEQIWHLTTYQVEANSPEEAENLIYAGKGKLLNRENEDITDLQILDIRLINNKENSNGKN